MERGERCPCCGYRRRTYKDRGSPTRERVVEALKGGPLSAPALAELIGAKLSSIHNYLRRYEEQGIICRQGLEEFRQVHSFSRTLRKKVNTVQMQHYRTLWGLPHEHRA